MLAGRGGARQGGGGEGSRSVGPPPCSRGPRGRVRNRRWAMNQSSLTRSARIACPRHQTTLSPPPRSIPPRAGTHAPCRPHQPHSRTLTACRIDSPVTPLATFFSVPAETDQPPMLPKQLQSHTAPGRLHSVMHSCIIHSGLTTGHGAVAWPGPAWTTHKTIFFKSYLLCYLWQQSLCCPLQ